MEARLARVEADIGHVRSDISDIKGLLARLAPRIDEIYGKLPHLSTKEDLARLELGTKEDITRLAAEIEKRPTRRQTMVDVAMIVGLIGVLVTLGTRLAH